jgi:GMP synthase (glutamine-hydrolysing)
LDVLILTHAAHEGPGAFGDALSDAGASVRTVAFHLDPAARPELGNAAMVLSMGGPMSAVDDGAHPWLAIEVALLAQAARENRKILGICLGSQILARALGARVYRATRPEIGFGPVTLTRDGGDDPVLAGLRSPETVLHWHHDTFDLPPNAVGLASSESTPNQAYRVGRHAYGLQFHMEVGRAMMEEWVGGAAMQASLAATEGAPSAEALLAGAAENEKRLAWLCSSVLNRLMNLL